MDNSIFFTDLDSTLDTRLATIFKLDNRASLVNIANDDYFNRTQDLFKGVDYNSYISLYENRDKRILESATVTKIPIMIMDFAENTYLSSKNDLEIKKPKVILNLYPYKLDKDEIANIIKGLALATEGKIDIETVYMDYEELTPNWIDTNVDILCMYNYKYWLDAQSENNNFNTQRCCETTLLAPKVIFSKELPNVDLNGLFLDMEKFISPFISIKFIPAIHFSTVLRITEDYSK